VPQGEIRLSDVGDATRRTLATLDKDKSGRDAGAISER
jgi:hypothetical protein